MYLAALVPENEWLDDPSKIGWIQVRYKRENRWAKPCLPFGNFGAPSLEWIKKNRGKFKVWVTPEMNPTTMREQDSLIYNGFYPIGGDNFPDSPDIEDRYPNVNATEVGNWRMVLDEENNKWQLFNTGRPDPDFIGPPLLAPLIDELHLELDPTDVGLKLRLNDADLVEIKPGRVTMKAEDLVEMILNDSTGQVVIDALVANILHDVEVRLGDGSDRVVLESLLSAYLASATVATGMGPSSPLLPPVVPDVPPPAPSLPAATFSSKKVTTE